MRLWFCLLAAVLPFAAVRIPRLEPGPSLLIAQNVIIAGILIALRSHWQEMIDWLKRSSRIFIFGGIFLTLGFISILTEWPYGMNYMLGSIGLFYTKWITAFLLYALSFYLINTKRDIFLLVFILMDIFMIISLWALSEYEPGGKRLRILFNDPNMLGVFLTSLLFIPAGILMTFFRKPKYWALGVILFIGIRAMTVTFSRGAYLAFAAGLLVMAFLQSKILFSVLLAITLFLAFRPEYLPSTIRHRIGETIGGGMQNSVQELQVRLDPSLNNRIHLWQGAWEIIKSHPFFGVGYNRFRQEIIPYWPEGKSKDAHNIYLMVAAEMGIPALLALIGILMTIGADTVVSYRKVQDPFLKSIILGFAGFMPAVLLSYAYETNLDDLRVTGYFWILAGIISRLRFNLQNPDTTHNVIPAKAGIL